MSTLQFIASLVSSLAWPIVTLATALIFRKHIPKIASGIFSGRLLKKIKFGPVDAGLVSSEVGHAMQSLRELKNRVSHESDAELTKGRAIQYALVAAEALAALRRGQSPKNSPKPTP